MTIAGRTLAVLAVLLALGCPIRSHAQTAVPSATLSLVRGAVEVAGKLVPLPPGRWLPVAEGIERHGGDTFASRALARIENGAVEGVVIVRANAGPRPGVFTGPGECARSDIHLAYVAYDTTADGLCMFINHVVLSGDVAGPPVWLAARERLATLGALVTETWLAVGIRARTGSHVVDVRYYFAPPDFRSALPERDWAGNRWSPERAFADSDRRASIRRLGAWTVWAREAVELGLRGQIPDAALPPSPWDGPDLGRRLVERRIATVEHLKATGRMADDEYRRQRRQLEMATIDPERSELPLWRRSLWKRFTHGVASATESFGVSYLVIGSLWPSLGFTALFELVSPVGTYLHQLIWPGAVAEDHTRPRDFAEIGHND